MKRRTVFLIAIAVFAITFLCEYALSILNQEAWSNYSYSWDTPMVAKNKNVKASVLKFQDDEMDEITVCK